MKMEKTGNLIIEPIRETDWEFGGETGIVSGINLASGNWEPYLAPNEPQRKMIESNSCVSFGAVKSVTTQINFLLKNNLLTPITVAFLTDEGYIVNGVLNISDRFVASLSGTTAQGNSFPKVWDAIRKFGLVPEADWPWTDEDTLEEYLATPTEAVKAKGKRFLQYFDIKYEWVLTGVMSTEKLEKALLQAPLHIGTPVCLPDWNNENVPVCIGMRAAHATMLFNMKQLESFSIHDQYNPYRKNLAWKYEIPYAVKGLITEKKYEDVRPFTHLFSRPIYYKERSAEVSFLQEALRREGLMKIQPTGYYGTITKKAVMDFQYKYSVAPLTELAEVKGEIVGRKTLKKLNELYAPDFLSSNWFIEFIRGLFAK